MRAYPTLPRITLSAVLLLAGGYAVAQFGSPNVPAPTPLPEGAARTGEAIPRAHGLAHLLELIGGPTTPLVIIAIAVIVIVALFFLLRRGGNQWEGTYSEPEQPHSRYEQLLAEIQGLRLRLAGGESPGYYRKIETLSRVFLERSGFPGARQMSEAEIKGVLTGSSHLQPQQAQAIASIFERSRQGGEHESEKLDFSADDLLRDLNALIRQVEGAATPRHA